VYSVVSRRPGAARAGELALKVMLNMLGDQSSALHDQFRAEYELLHNTERLPRHPNVVPVLCVFDDLATAERLPQYDFDPRDVSPRTTFVVMPLCDRGDLASAMKSAFSAGDFLPDARVRDLLIQLLGAVAHLKRHRVVHRDIKADNVMLRSVPGSPASEHLVLIDFGQCLDCELYELTDFRLPLPCQFPRGGAPAFLAPEVLLPKPGPRTVIDYAKNDDWAIGMLLHDMLAGPAATKPFGACSDPTRFADGDYVPPDLHAGGYSLALGEVARELLRVDPTARMDVNAALARLR
jgi:serine/threonine protein kinase